MRIFRRAAARLLLWSLLFAGLWLLFARLCSPGAEALRDTERLLTVLTPDGPVSMTMADYLPGAVAAEMPAAFGPEALKAQAVAARTYVLAARRHDGADVCTDSGCCLAWADPAALRTLWGPAYDANLRSVQQAVAATDGQILTYGGEAIQAVFHASSAGATEDSGAVWSARPYLVSVASPETPETVPELFTDVRFTPEELAARLEISCTEPPESWLQGAERDDAGRVALLRFGGQAFSGAEVRRRLGLRSTAFTVSYDGGSFLFTVAGNGHGVGMSQYGAKLLAARGWTYDEILAHYYPGTVLAFF